MKKKLDFTGERLIPEINKKATFYYEHLVRYLLASQLVQNKIVLDAGCGTGYGSFILASFGKAKKVYAVDISKETIEYAQSKYSHKNIQYQIDDVEKLKTIFNNSIDITTSFEVVEHLKNQEEFLVQIKRVLKNNGIFLVSTPNKYTYPKGNPFHTKELYPEEFKKFLKKYFKSVRFYHQVFEFAQIIKPESLKENFTLEEKFSLLTNQIFTNSINPKNSQYIIAICSDNKLPNLKLLSIASNKVDNLDLTYGMISLGKQFNQLQNKINKLHQELKIIKSSKFFKLWQSYCKIREKILRRNEKK